MIIIGTFEHSNRLELLLAAIESVDISRKHIMVVPMSIDRQNPFQFDSQKRDIRYKAIEVGIACATGCSVIGTSVGFILTLGPIFWGLTAAAAGFFIGFSIHAYSRKLYSCRSLPNKLPEVVVIVQCQEEQSRVIMDEMWKYSAITVGEAPQ